jgi:D-arginine dehydrogenase
VIESRCEYLIVGAGFAGAATAYHLSRRGAENIVVLEQEAVPGFHASGRNAAMLRQCVPDADLVGLTRDGANFIRNLPDDWSEPVQLKQNGSLLLGSGIGWAKLQRDAEAGRNAGIDVELWTPERARTYVPALEQAEFEGAVWCSSDGIVYIHALLFGYLKGAASKGVRVHYGQAVRAIHRLNHGSFEVLTDGASYTANVIVNGCGAWANRIAKMAGADELPLKPCRRHLFVSGPLPWVDKKWPFVWDVTHDIYFRPEADGLLLCACDQQELPPGDPPVDATVQELLAEKIQRHMPALAEVNVSRSWAGFRTLTSDGRFVIGWDAECDGFFWVAGLGGHGMTTSSAVGELAADLLAGGRGKKSDAFTPERFGN